MRNFLIIFTVLLSLFITFLPAKATEITASRIELLIKNYVIKHYKDLYKGQVEVTCGRMPGVPFDVPDGKLEIKVNGSLGDAYVQRTIVRIAVYVDGKFQKIVGIPVTLALYENVWIASQPIQRDDAIGAVNVEAARRDISKMAGTAARVTNNLMNTRAKKSFTTGDILDHRFIEKNPVVLRNSLVEIVFRSSTVAITIPGEAMENGQMGDLIRVKSREFKKEYMGKVIAQGTILVNI